MSVGDVVRIAIEEREAHVELGSVFSRFSGEFDQEKVCFCKALMWQLKLIYSASRESLEFPH